MVVLGISLGMMNYVLNDKTELMEYFYIMKTSRDTYKLDDRVNGVQLSTNELAFGSFRAC